MSREKNIVSKESEQILLALQRQNERLKALISTAQDAFEINNNLFFIVLNRLKSLEEKTNELQLELEQLKVEAKKE